MNFSTIGYTFQAEKIGPSGFSYTITSKIYSFLYEEVYRVKKDQFFTVTTNKTGKNREFRYNN